MTESNEQELQNLSLLESTTKRESKVEVDYITLEQQYSYVPSPSTQQQVKHSISKKCFCSIPCVLGYIKSLFPILIWLPQYKRNFIIGDMIAGFTAAILHLPQGMAYGLLAGVKPENGLYMAIFPMTMYFFLGTSKHASIGTFAVISLMINSAVSRMDSNFLNSSNFTAMNETNTSIHVEAEVSNLEIVTTLAFTVGIIQLLLRITALGSLSMILSDQLVSGFCTGAAVHVFAAMLPEALGISVRRYSGVLKLVYVLVEIIDVIKFANWVTIVITVVSLIILWIVKEEINARFRDKLKMPIPIDIMVVAVATLISYLVDFEGKYKVNVVGHIPTGFPQAKPPRLDFIVPLISDGFAIAVTSFVITLSIAKILAKKHQYSVDANQELFALGSANIFSSFFACFPCSAALARSCVQERSGAQTQVAGAISAFLIFLVILFFAPYFYTLPKCILSAVILVALKSMFQQAKEFMKAWKISKFDGMIWCVTMISTVILDVVYGLLAGIVFALITVILRTAFPTRSFLGRIGETDLYLDVKKFKEAKELEGLKIFHFESALYFLNKDLFKSTLLGNVPVVLNSEDSSNVDKVNFIIIDCSSFSYVDVTGIETLKEVIKEYREIGIAVVLAGCSVSMWGTLRTNEDFKDSAKSIVFPTISEAVRFCTAHH